MSSMTSRSALLSSSLPKAHSGVAVVLYGLLPTAAGCSFLWPMIGIPSPIISEKAGFDSPMGRALPTMSSLHGKVCNRRSNPH